MKMDKVANSGNDEFYTPLYAIKPIEKYLKKGSTIWCPFDTKESLYCKYFFKMGYNVIYSSLNDGLDFFKIKPNREIDYIISNPPYSKKGEVLQRLFELKIPFAMLVGVVGLFESKKRFEMFKNNEFETMYFNKRISYFKNYEEQKPALHPPFSSIYLCSKILPQKYIFEEIDTKETILIEGVH